MTTIQPRKTAGNSDGGQFDRKQNSAPTGELDFSDGKCGAVWDDSGNPCDYGDSAAHVCYNAPGACASEHMCMCEHVTAVARAGRIDDPRAQRSAALSGEELERELSSYNSAAVPDLAFSWPEKPVTSTKVRNALKKAAPHLEVNLKNVNINGRIHGCSGFVTNPENGLIVYVSTDANHGISREALVRYADDDKTKTTGAIKTSSRSTAIRPALCWKCCTSTATLAA